MCVIAGFSGTRRAAPVLLEMLEREEGLAGGYYTGLATVHEGRVHWRKVVGDLAELRRSTDAEDLPGEVGVAHGRPKCGGGAEWAHPFVGCDEALAYIANGSSGVWDKNPRRPGTVRRLEREGHRFRSACAEPGENNLRLQDGSAVHMSEVMSHRIEELLHDSGSPETALQSAFLDLPAEIVALCVFAGHPKRVYGARWNMPACVAFDGEAGYVASSPEAFPPSARWWTWVPVSTGFRIWPGGVSMSPLGGAPSEQIVDDVDRAAAREVILKAIENADGLHVESLLKLMDPLSRQPLPRVRYDAVYQSLYDLMCSGLIQRRVDRVEGAQEGLVATRFFHVKAD